MAVKNPFSKARRPRREAVSGTIARLTGHLKLPESQAPAPDNPPENNGVIRQQTGKLRLPSEVFESGSDISDERAGKVMWVVILVSLLFIGLITWFISLE